MAFCTVKQAGFEKTRLKILSLSIRNQMIVLCENSSIEMASKIGLSVLTSLKKCELDFFFFILIQRPNSPVYLTDPLCINGRLADSSFNFQTRLFFIICQFFAIFDNFSKFHRIFSTLHFEKWEKFSKNKENRMSCLLFHMMMDLLKRQVNSA